MSDWLLNETLQSVMGVIIVLLLLLLLGWGTTRVIGQRLIGLFESLIERIPLRPFDLSQHQAVPHRRGRHARRRTPGGADRLPDARHEGRRFHHPDIAGRRNGEDLAAIYVPTAPNPTSGYIEIVPLRDVTYTDWTFDQAMAFIVTGGSSAPETINFSEKP